MLTAKELALEVCKIGKVKVSKANYKVIVSAILAGMFIGFGFIGYIILAGGAKGTEMEYLGKFLGAFIFPVGLTLILIAGGELFTGNCMVTMGYMNKSYGLKLVIKNLSLVYAGNLIGSVILAFLVYQSNLLDHYQGFVESVAINKVGHSFGSAVIRGILCNVIVAMAVYMSYAGKSVGSRVLAFYLPIVLFVISGFEHSVANMFFLPLAQMMGANISTFDIVVGNLIPVTIGNVIAGSIIVPGAYYLIFIKE